MVTKTFKLYYFSIRFQKPEYVIGLTESLSTVAKVDLFTSEEKPKSAEIIRFTQGVSFSGKIVAVRVQSIDNGTDIVYHHPVGEISLEEMFTHDNELIRHIAKKISEGFDPSDITTLISELKLDV